LLRSDADPRGGAVLSTDPQPWKQATATVTSRKNKYEDHDSPRQNDDVKGRQGDDGVRRGYASEPIPEAELAAIATESSQAERRADDAERELMEWKKMRFMEDRVGEDFGGIILSCTKYGFFVELDDLFIEGLVPITSLSGWGSDERFVFRDTDKQIVSTRGGRAFKMGQRVHVLLDRIDRQQRRLQFALVPSTELPEIRSLRKGKATMPAEREGRPSPDRSGKKKTSSSGKKKARMRDKKNKGKRK
jgi:ribonuclease R